MAKKKEFKFYGKTWDEVKDLSVDEFAELLPSRKRRSLRRGFTDAQQSLLQALERKDGPIETHCRAMVVLPSMVGRTIKVHNGKEFDAVKVEKDMIGYRLGELVLTRHIVKHNAPGIGATRSSAALSVR